MLMDWMRKQKGSISIFLCLILMPMVTFATMIIDASRLQAAKTAISGAGDLTLNAAMSEYEQLLKDMYGLFAGVQNDEQLKPALKDYFTRTIEGKINGGALSDSDSGVTVEGLADSITDFVLNLDDDGNVDFGNLLNMKVDSFEICDVSSSAIANPAIMKRQIIDYMKYKGPVSLATTLINKLNFLKGSDKQVEAVKNKVKYATKLGEIEQVCKDAWDALNEYNAAAEAYNLSALSSDYVQQSGLSKALYRNIASWCYTACVAKLCSSVLPTQNTFSNMSITWNRSSVISDEEYSKYDNYDWNGAPTTAILSALSDIEGYMSRLIDVSDGSDSVLENVLSTPIKCDDSSVTYGGSVASGSKVSKMKDDLDAIKNGICEPFSGETSGYDLGHQLRDVYPLQWYYGNPDTSTKRMYGVVYGVYSAYEHLASVYSTGVTALWGHMELADAPTDEEWGAVSGNNTKFSKTKQSLASNSGPKGYLEAIEDVCFKNDKYESAYDWSIDRMNGVIAPYYTSIKDVKEKLDTLVEKIQAIVDKVGELEDSKENWNRSIEQMPDGATKAASKSDYDTTTEAIDLVAVSDLQSVITEIQKNVNSHIATIESIKFCGKSVALDELSGIEDYCKNATENMFYGILASDTTYRVPNNPFADSNSFTFATLDRKSMDYWKNNCQDSRFLYPTVAASFSAALNLTWSQPPTSNPTDYENPVSCPTVTASTISYDNTLISMHRLEKLDGDDGSGADSEHDKERFYVSLKSICEADGSGVDDTNQGYINQANTIGGNGENYSGPSGSESGSSGGGESGGESGGGESNSGEEDEAPNATLADILADIGDYCENETASTDDDDVGETAADGNSDSTSGFTVDTGKDDYVEDGNKSAGMLDSAKNVLSTIVNIADAVVQSAYLEEYFTEMFSCDTDRTNCPKNNGNALTTLSGVTLKSDTAWYAKEIEYILWGSGNLGANVAANYAMIYMIRFALNAIYAFTAPDIQSFALEIATAIAGWTVVGVPVVQAVITVGLALAESGIDIYKLRQGEGVAIYKNKTTFVCSPTGFVAGITDEVIEAAAQEAVSEIEKGINSMIDELASDASATVEDKLSDIELMINRYVEEQIESITSSIKNMYITPIINQITPILSQVHDAATNVNTVVESAIDNAFNAVARNIADLPAGVLRDVAEIISSYVQGQPKTNMIGAITDAINGAADTVSPESIKTAIEGQIDDWTEKIKEEARGKLASWKAQLMAHLNENLDAAVSEVKGYISTELGNLSDNITGALTSSLGNAAEGLADVKDASAGAGGFTLDYKEYCKIFVFIHIVADENKMLHRAAALVEANMQVGHAGASGISGFKARNAYSMFFVESNVRMKTLFPWAADVSLDEIMGDDGLSFNMGGLTRDGLLVHYSGINGY